jgi:exosortase family protein XrtF
LVEQSKKGLDNLIKTYQNCEMLTIIHVLNITRIALLMVAFYNFPEANFILHDILFPLVIYGTVFILWIIWVNKFSFYAKTPIK